MIVTGCLPRELRQNHFVHVTLRKMSKHEQRHTRVCRAVRRGTPKGGMESGLSQRGLNQICVCELQKMEIVLTVVKWEQMEK